MATVFVHGNPETPAIWGPLLRELALDDAVTLSPPGFGAPVPEGFAATRLEYIAWLIRQLERFDDPVDLVGHDWGGGHVVGAVAARPDLVRTWAVDVLGIFDHDYVWHDAAQQWQTPEVGEQAVAGFIGDPDALPAILVSLGMTPDIAAEVAAAADDTMASCILALYRSAAQPAMVQAGEDLAGLATRPGLAIAATEDHYVGDQALVRRMAAKVGAHVHVLDAVGHWWMIQDPESGAAMLRDFWSSATGQAR